MKQLMTGLLVSALLLVGGVPRAMADQILLRQSDGTMTPWGGVGEKGSVTCDNCSGGGGGGGAVQTLTIASGVTTNTSSTPVAGVSGNKTFWAEVTGTGAVTATVAIYGNRTNTNSNGVLLATITLSGTTTATDAAAVSTAAYPYYYVTTTNVTGTGATVGVYAFY